MARLAVVLSHPVQYFSPWFRHVAATTQIELRVFYLWDSGVVSTRDIGFGETFKWDVPLLKGYDYEFVPNASRDPGTHHFAGLTNPDVAKRIAAWHPDAILLFGYKYRSHLQVLTSSRLRRVPVLFRGDSHNMGRESGLRTSAGTLVRRILFRRFSAFLSVGSANRQYLSACGIADEQIHYVPHCVDNARFRTAAAKTSIAAAGWKLQLGISPNATVILFAGKLEPKKAPDLLLRAFIKLMDERCTNNTEVALLYVGSGELAPMIRSMAGKRVGSDVFMVPFQNQTMMPTVYAAADVVVLPSASASETWGLVINEAMNMGVPAIVSSYVGCGPDLVLPGETGWIFPSGNLSALVTVLKEAISDRDRLRRMGAAARRHIDGFSYEVATRALEIALTSVLDTSSGLSRSTSFLNASTRGARGE